MTIRVLWLMVLADAAAIRQGTTFVVKHSARSPSTGPWNTPFLRKNLCIQYFQSVISVFLQSSQLKLALPFLAPKRQQLRRGWDAAKTAQA